MDVFTELAALRRGNQYHSRARCVFCIIFAVLLFLAATPAPAGVLEDGFAALDLGDFETAERLLRPLGEQGDPRARSLLGLICAHGKKDREAALWYHMAAEQGFAPAQYSLGVMYDKGRGVAQDDAEASRWYRMAAEQGDVDAQTDLGIMYLHGRGVPKDDGEAASWFRKAAERGNSKAQGLLGLVYMEGRGAPRDFVQGYLWLNLAAAQGEETGIKGRDIAERLMTPAQIAEAQALSRDWKLKR